MHGVVETVQHLQILFVNFCGIKFLQNTIEFSHFVFTNRPTVDLKQQLIADPSWNSCELSYISCQLMMIHA